MKWNTIFRRAAAGALCLLWCVSGLAQTARAIEAPGSIENFKPNANCTLTIRYRAYPNVTFQVYRVASVDKDVNFTVEGVFQTAMQHWLYKDLSKQTQSQWSALAEYLSTYAANARPSAVVSTGTPGTGIEYVDMKVNNLKPGLYLVVGSSYRETYASGQNTNSVRTTTPAPYLICLPNWTPGANGSGSWSYDVLSDARGKVDVGYNSTKNIQVTKSWVTNGNARPDSATVVLYRNGIPYSRIVLSQANNWKYIWTNLDTKYTWTVGEENVPANYFYYIDSVNPNNVSILNYAPRPGGNNSYPVTTAWVTPPVTTSRPTPTPDISIDDPDVPLGNKTPPPVNTPPDDEIELDDPDVPLGDLPQTGQLWWPVPLLAVMGMVFVLIGLIQRRRGEYDEE